jgi:hypothetical protein
MFSEYFLRSPQEKFHDILSYLGHPFPVAYITSARARSVWLGDLELDADRRLYI